MKILKVIIYLILFTILVNLLGTATNTGPIVSMMWLLVMPFIGLLKGSISPTMTPIALIILVVLGAIVPNAAAIFFSIVIYYCVYKFVVLKLVMNLVKR